MEHKCFLQI